MGKPRFRLTDLEIVSVGLIDRPAVKDSTFVLVKGQGSDEELTAHDHQVLDGIIAKNSPHTTQKREAHRPAPDAVPQHELARVRAFLGGR